MTQSPSSKRSRALTLLSNDLSPFGRQLVQAGYVDGDQMQQALAETRKSGRPLTDVLESMTGRQLSPELLRQYKKQQLFELKILYGVESLDPEIDPITHNQMGSLIDSLIPIDICRRYKLIPLMKKDTEPPSLLVAMVSPDNLDAQDDLKRILRPQGIALQRMVIAIEDYEKLLEQYLNEQLRKTQLEEQQKAVAIDTDKFEGGLEDAPAEDDLDLDSARNDAEDKPIIDLVNKILMKALQDGVSDIHVEPQEEHLRVRFRKDGVLQQAYEKLPKKIAGAVAARFKIMAELDIAERRLPQDGKIRRVFKGRKVDFRVSTLPSRYGEKVVLRILDNTQTQLGLDLLITDPETLEIVREMSARPFGLILVTGPTGSGKSTSLYSVLAERNDPGVNISTAEDPIEYSLPGITQVQVIREKGMDFASILRSFLRQDPDVILVGETRDHETAKTAIEAALTGHLVLTTLHTNDAAGAIARLDEMGVEPFMISGALLGILAQRLMRKVCDECRISYEPDPEELQRFGMPASSAEDSTFYRANTIPVDQREAMRVGGTLCQKCNGVGYKGRVGVYEVMRITERLQALINEGASTELIKEAAVDEGMKTLLAYSLMLVRQGHTTLEEVERVTFTDSGLEAEMKAKRKSVLTCRSCSAQLQQEWSECPYCLTPRFQD
ncbi:MAG: ATPase, T2SS/T4P/T4SS family [Cyanobacteriota bacterium]|nr:ATPase, T2SS/T4P/T4SS family [Cyanobacteriota bacterium]